MRSRWFVIGVGLLALGACGSSNKAAAPTTTVATTSSTASTTTSSRVVSTSSSSASIPPSSTVTEVACVGLPLPKTPVTASYGSASLLTGVAVTHDPCADTVTFDFTAKTPTPPSYTVGYGTPPFSQDASGAPVRIAGNAFIVVKVKPGYGYDFETGTRTYTGPSRMTPSGAHFVTEIVETGDFEGVLTWVIGLRSKQPFAVAAVGTPHPQLRLRIG